MNPATLVMRRAHPAPPRRPVGSAADSGADGGADLSGDPVAPVGAGAADPFFAVRAVR